MFMLEEIALQKMPKFCNISDLAKLEAFYKVIFIKDKPLISEECDVYLLFKKFLETSKILEYNVIVLCKYKYLSSFVLCMFKSIFDYLLKA